MNEATWQRVAQWEMLHRGECDTPTVLRFQAKPHDLRHAHSSRDAVATRCKVDERSLRWEGLLTCDTFFAFASAQQSRGAVQCGHVPLGARGHPARGNLADQDAPAARPHLQPRHLAEHQYIGSDGRSLRPLSELRGVPGAMAQAAAFGGQQAASGSS
ncbi:hypothetical protein CHLRE_12g526131v5 [Chlamydomonas reinhardtii]|uniref:holocytochrome-c synthase n=1 Tax=Chlamydomonas reinhardtii TaxID=3055 RepID=A0A2K3D4G3_CHLRE|nr:uncharacterized protein CHLRE_12g526131v5 [Chlamydomonas reinhardtii]PNW75417.1 hypothetical protein CHLRE_12g526131v5 [Chlamydomonas reinhardtii]